MKFQKPQKGASAGPSSALGLIRFFDTESGGPKLSPEFVLIITLVFIVGMIILHFFAA